MAKRPLPDPVLKARLRTMLDADRQELLLRYPFFGRMQHCLLFRIQPGRLKCSRSQFPASGNGDIPSDKTHLINDFPPDQIDSGAVVDVFGDNGLAEFFERYGKMFIPGMKVERGLPLSRLQSGFPFFSFVFLCRHSLSSVRKIFC